MKGFHELQAMAGDGTAFDFGTLRGRLVLVVNTASRCGFTPQYSGLEALHRKYRDHGLSVIAFPCDQFAHQEPAGDAEIAAFCERNFGVTFPLMAKIEVNGPRTHPVFAWLKKKAPGFLGSSVKWNFTKFLVWPDGSRVKRFAPTVEPHALSRYIEKALGA